MTDGMGGSRAVKATHGAEPWAFRSPVDRLGGSTVVKGGRPDGSRDRLARTFQSRKKVLTCRPWDRWARAVRMAATAASKAARPLTGPALSLGSGRMPGRGWWCRAVRGQHEAGRRNDVEEAPATISNLPRRRKSAAGGPSTARTGLGSISFRDTKSGRQPRGKPQSANRSLHSPNAMALEGRALSWSCIVIRDAPGQEHGEMCGRQSDRTNTPAPEPLPAATHARRCACHQSASRIHTTSPTLHETCQPLPTLSRHGWCVALPTSPREWTGDAGDRAA